jgi:hypothetical protein
MPFAFGDFGPLAGHLRYAERTSRKMARSLFYGMSRFGPGLEKRQAFLGRIVDIGAELYAIVAACVYARMLVETEGRREAYELADLFTRQSRLRIDQLFAALWNNEDTRNYRAAGQMLEGRYEWLEEGLLGGWDTAGEPPAQELPKAV